jgi:uncharacterized RDD family membrane protein YckC
MKKVANGLWNALMSYLMVCVYGLGIALIAFLIIFPIGCLFGTIPRWLFWIWLAGLIALIIWRRIRKKKGGTP